MNAKVEKTTARKSKTSAPASKKVEIHGPMQRAEPEMVGPVKPTAKPEPKQEVPPTPERSENPEYLGVYRKKQEKAAGADVDPNWKYKDKIFVLDSRRPKSPASVMGVLVSYVEQAGENGISGMELASKLRHHNWSGARSAYVANSLPPVGWAEGYVNGALSTKQSYIKVKS